MQTESHLSRYFPEKGSTAETNLWRSNKPPAAAAFLTQPSIPSTRDWLMTTMQQQSVAYFSANNGNKKFFWLEPKQEPKTIKKKTEVWCLENKLVYSCDVKHITVMPYWLLEHDWSRVRHPGQNAGPPSWNKEALIRRPALFVKYEL